VRETVVVVKRRDFPSPLCEIVSCVIPWRRFVSPYIVSSPSLKDLPAVDWNMTALQWWLSQSDWCICGLDSPAIVGSHLRLRAGEGCLERIVAGFGAWSSDGGHPVLMGMNMVWRC